MPTKYDLDMKHYGTDTGDICIYQTNDNQSEDIRSLVWFSKRAHPETDLHFKWDIDYDFTWSEQGTLTPAAVFNASQTMEGISEAHNILKQTNDNQSEDIRSLVWFSKCAHPGTDLHFKWDIDYGFTWSEQGTLTPAAAFDASQTMEGISEAHNILKAEETKE